MRFSLKGNQNYLKLKIEVSNFDFENEFFLELLNLKIGNSYFLEEKLYILSHLKALISSKKYSRVWHQFNTAPAPLDKYLFYFIQRHRSSLIEI